MAPFQAPITGPFQAPADINADGRFPKIEDCVPDPIAAIGKLIVDPADAAFLGDAIGRLPNSDDLHHPVTLDLNGQVIVRATAADQPRPTELVLVNSGFSGEPTRLCTDRRFLARAANLGFGELCVFGPDKPVLARDDRRQMVWTVLDADLAAPVAADPVRIESPAAGTEAKTVPLRRHRTNNARLSTNGDTSPKPQQCQRERRQPSTNSTQSTPIE